MKLTVPQIMKRVSPFTKHEISSSICILNKIKPVQNIALKIPFYTILTFISYLPQCLILSGFPTKLNMT